MPDSTQLPELIESRILNPKGIREIETIEIYQPPESSSPWSLQYVDYSVGDIRHYISSGTPWDADLHAVIFCQTAHNSEDYDIAIFSDIPTAHVSWAETGFVWAVAYSWEADSFFAVSSGGRHHHHNGTIYRCILTHSKNAPVNEPGLGSSWATYWAVELEITDTPLLWELAGKYFVDDLVDFAGVKYKCTLEHYRNNAAVNQPGTGSSWEEYWVEVLLGINTLLVNDKEPLTAFDENGAEKTFSNRGFAIGIAGEGTTGVRTISITVDNADLVVSSYLAEAIAANRPIEVIYRLYLSNDLSGPKNVPPLKLYLSNTEISGSTVSGELNWIDLVNARFPNAFYKRENFPTL